ncbi:MAG: hypothetical protein AB1305_05925, partial [Candidatus Hadarchaeota archaeon]
MRKVSIIVVAVIAIAIIAAGTYQRQRTPPTYSGPLKGVTLTPKSFSQADFTEFFEKARQAGNVVSWAGDWNELPASVAGLAATYGYTPIIEAQFFTQSTGLLLRLLDNSTKQSYISSAVSYVENYQLKYIAFGIEVNILYEKSRSDY